MRQNLGAREFQKDRLSTVIFCLFATEGTRWVVSTETWLNFSKFFKLAVSFIPLNRLGRDRTWEVSDNEAKQSSSNKAVKAASYPNQKLTQKNSRELWARQGVAKAKGAGKKRHPGWHTTCKRLCFWRIYGAREADDGSKGSTPEEGRQKVIF